MTADGAPLRVQLVDGVLSITFCDPSGVPVIDQAWADAFLDVTKMSAAARPRVVVLASEGSMFLAGGSVAHFASLLDRDGAAAIQHLADTLHAAIARLSAQDAPVIASVQGAAAGAGLSLVAACDLVVASDSASFTSAYTKIGLSPDGGATYNLPRVIGLRRAAELTLTNRVLTAREALDWGLVNVVVPPDELRSATNRLVATLADGATGALGVTKRLLAGSADALEDQMKAEASAISGLFRSTDAAEGIRAFVARRSPAFTGLPD